MADGGDSLVPIPSHFLNSEGPLYSAVGEFAYGEANVLTPALTFPLRSPFKGLVGCGGRLFERPHRDKLTLLQTLLNWLLRLEALCVKRNSGYNLSILNFSVCL